jgi:tetratricopeptide (TPR) repeat protein
MKDSKTLFFILLAALLLNFGCATSDHYKLDKNEKSLDDIEEESASERPTDYLPKGAYFASLGRGKGLLDKAAQLVEKKRYAEAHKVVNEMLKKRENVDGAYYYKAYIAILEKKYEMARYMFDKLKGKKKFIAAINNNLGVIFMKEGSKENAIYHYSVALKRSPYFFPALVNRARMRLEAGLYRKAYEDMSRALSVNNKEEDVILLHGIAARGVKLYKEAEESLKRLRNTREGLYNLGLLYYEDMKDWRKAIDAFEKYLKKGSGFGEGDMAEKYISRARSKLSE